MKRHDKKYLEKLTAPGLENEDFARYVDDETEVLAAIEPGVRYDGQRLVKIQKQKQTNVFKTCLVRQLNEAVRIEMSKADCVMNSKAEFHQAPLVRVVPVTGLLEDQEARADPRQPAEGRGRGRGRRAGGRRAPGS